ncbi:MAG: chorismate mutase [SAR202 cluster bacterium]|nr:chorismate mutase [SAR202 cluster bacterium]
MITCRGVRGATTATENTPRAIYAATREMLNRLIEANHIEEGDVAAAYFTMTQDLNAAFPAAAARQLGWNHTALMCGAEIAVPDSLPRCIRVLILWNTDKEQRQVVNVYLNGTETLRLTGIETT